MFVDENALENERIFGFPVQKRIPETVHGLIDYAFFAFGNNQLRHQMSDQFSQFPALRKRKVSVPSPVFY